MNDPRAILLTTDLSPLSGKALGPAEMLARSHGAKILLLHVGDLIPLIAAEYPLIDLQAVEEQQRKLATEGLARFAAANLPEDLEVEQIVTLGVPHLEILRVAKERGADMIVMATHGGGFISHLVLGSTTERVLRHADCPVLVVRDAAAQAR